MGCTQWIIWTHGMARRWWVHHSSKYVLPFKKFLIATPILSLNMLALLCSLFFFHYLSAQWSVLEYRKHVATLLLLSTRNMVKLDDFMKKYDAKETWSS